MYRFLLPFCLLVFYILPTHAQNGPREEVIHLSNHWVIRGTIILRTDSSVHIRTHDGNIFVFSPSQIEKITTEPSWPFQMRKNHHWTSFTELGPLIAGRTTEKGVTTAAFSFQTIIAYRFRPSLALGGGIGADLYATQTILPLFGTFRADILPKDAYTLFGFADAGYGWNITQRSETGTEYKGGLLYAAGVGIRIPFNPNAGFLLSIGYRYQKTVVTEAGLPSPVIYRRIALRAGFYL